MHPAFSVIFFTTASGIGYGLLFLGGLAVALDPYRLDPIALLLAIGLGSAFAALGLISSMLHLGQPQRAWRALSQWRSSWLSREGVAALVTFVPALALYALAWRNAIPMGLGGLEAPDAIALRATGIVLAGCTLLTVFCTARIYTSLKTIAAWRNGYVLPGYLLFALLGGASWLQMIALLVGGYPPFGSTRVLAALVLAAALAIAVLKHAYWRFLDSAPGLATTASATGLAAFGAVRGVEAPHTEENYLTREMGFVLARKHAARLRLIALGLFALLPGTLALTAFVSALPVLRLPAAIAAALSVLAGTFVERWLFFAEAKHVVMLYYAGARA